VRRILDAGCGIGLLRAPFAAVLPRARYTGLEHSEYLCAKYGWTHGSVAHFSAPKPYDLVVCYDVLQYLDDREASRAIANFAQLTQAAVYVSRADARGLAPQLRSHAYRSRGASCAARPGIGADCSATSGISASASG
jgi:2-polyprenyl-3-methyl-5-hydroxy-6-metoxy-1,4-benzoquinol methylase